MDWTRNYKALMAGMGQSGGLGALSGGSLAAQQNAHNQQINNQLDFLQARGIQSLTDSAYANSQQSDAASPVVGDIRYDVNGRQNIFTGDVWVIVPPDDINTAVSNQSDAQRMWSGLQELRARKSAAAPTVETVERLPRVIELEAESE